MTIHLVDAEGNMWCGKHPKKGDQFLPIEDYPHSSCDACVKEVQSSLPKAAAEALRNEADRLEQEYPE